jgi:hypothetical protein
MANSRARISKKISKLRHEGVSRDQSIATAINMGKRGRITKSGGYRRVKKSRGKRHGRRYNRGRKGR